MVEDIRIVVHFQDGRLLKGTTKDFLPNRPGFHLLPLGEKTEVEVHHKHLKAVFFVRDFKGNAKRREIRGFLNAPNRTSDGTKIAVLFHDGEFLCGYSRTYSADRDAFIMFPSDPRSNNLRVYVNALAVAEVKAGPAADVLARRRLGERTA